MKIKKLLELKKIEFKVESLHTKKVRLNDERKKETSEKETKEENIGVFPKWSRTFTEFSEFRETDNH